MGRVTVGKYLYRTMTTTLGHCLVRWLPLFLFFVLFLLDPPPGFSAAITDIRFWSAPDHTRVVLDLTESTTYESRCQEHPSECRVELTGITSIPKKRELEVNDRYLKKITLTDLGRGKARLVLHQKVPLQATVFTLKPDLGKPHRLVIDLIDPVQERLDQEERQRLKETRPKGIRVVVIDPGHGGEDPGAIGPRRTMEKEVVLEIGKRLISQLNREKEMKAFLTRKGDYFIPLEQRVRIAREYGADLFVSLHADGSFNPQARGASVYCLSLSGASDQAAKLLADKENMSNLIGGALLRPASLSRDPHVNQILLDLMQNHSMKESFRFAELALEALEKVHFLKFPSYRQANFVVLRAPDIPSVLIEVAYITNREDERLLNQDSFQDRVASHLSQAILQYFR